MTLSITSNEQISAPTVELLGAQLTMSTVTHGRSFQAQRTVLASHAAWEGPTAFRVFGYADANGNVGANYSTTSDSTSVVIGNDA